MEKGEARSGKEGRRHRLESSNDTQVTTSRHLKSSRKMGAKEVLCIEIGAKETKHKLAILVI